MRACRYCKNNAPEERCRCCCNSECTFSYDEENDPCEGPLSVVDEESNDDDWYWIHCCEKHKAKYKEMFAYHPPE